MWPPRHAYGVYFATVFAVSLALWLGARIAPTLVVLVLYSLLNALLVFKPH